MRNALWQMQLADFVLVTIILGCGAAMLTGRAVARSWQPIWQALAWMIPLAVAVRFIHFIFFRSDGPSVQSYLLEQVEALPVIDLAAGAIGDVIGLLGAALAAVMGADRLTAFQAFFGERTVYALESYAVDLVILFAAAAFGHRFIRARRMVARYPWLVTRSGPLSWRLRPDRSEG
jgi:hypothetical protein